MRRQCVILKLAKMSALLIAIVAVTCIVGPRSASAITIGIDAVHGFDADHNLATGSDFDTFRSTLTGLGHTLVSLTSFGASDLSAVDVAILMTPFSQNSAPYSASEIAAINAFASYRAVFTSDSSMFGDAGAGSDRPITFGDNLLLLQNITGFLEPGSGAFFIGDEGTGFDVTNWNSLVAAYGVSFATSGTEGDGHTITDFVGHPVTAGLQSIGVDYQLQISTSAPSIDLTLNSGADDALAAFGSVSAVPEPATLLLIGSGLIGLLGLRRKFKRS